MPSGVGSNFIRATFPSVKGEIKEGISTVILLWSRQANKVNVVSFPKWGLGTRLW